jgi:hypothetical protein
MTKLICTRKRSNIKLDLTYHRRCEAVAKLLGRALYGSTLNAGFATTQGEDIPHVVVEFIEKHHLKGKKHGKNRR